MEIRTIKGGASTTLIKSAGINHVHKIFNHGPNKVSVSGRNITIEVGSLETIAHSADLSINNDGNTENTIVFELIEIG